MPELPRDEEELQRREAVGIIRASRFVRRYANSGEPINISVVSKIHKEIFYEAWPEIAGKYRTENLKITGSKHLPPHHSEVGELMNEADLNLVEKIKNIKKLGGISSMSDISNKALKNIDDIVNCAAWLHHIILKTLFMKD